MPATQEVSSARILDHIRRYRIGLPRFCYRAVRASNEYVTVAEVKQALKRLHGHEGYLDAAPLFGRQKYYYLSQRYLNVLGNENADVAGRALREDEKLTAYAMLRICFASDGERRCTLTAGDFRARFPDVAEALGVVADQSRAARYYLADDRLGLLRVDRGGPGRWDRILSYCERDITRQASRTCIRQLMGQGRFELTLVTATPQKAGRLQHAIYDRPLHDQVRVHVVVLNELLHILAPPPTAGAGSNPHRGF